MKAQIKSGNTGTPSEYFYIVIIEEAGNFVHPSGKNWKTRAGAERYAQKDGLEILPDHEAEALIIANIHKEKTWRKEHGLTY